MAVDKLHEVIQRWQNTPEESLKPEDHQLFKNIGWTCIEQGRSAQMLDFIQDEKNQQIVSYMGCSLLGSLVNEVLKKEESLSHCQATITHLTKTCSPTELLPVFLKLVEDIHPDAIADTITVLVPHLQTVLLRLDEKKASAVGLALSALHKQVSRLPVPYTKEQEIGDKYGLCCCCTALTSFVEPFLEEVKRQDNGNRAAQDEELKTELLKFCMGSLREPLLQAQLDQAVSFPNKSPLWHFATEILVTLPAIQESLPDLLFYNPLRKKEGSGLLKDNTESMESRACLAYLLFVQLITIENFPAVFNPVFVLQCNMEYINLLLSRKDESWLLKGLELYAKSLERVEDNSLPVELLELKYFYSVPQSLLQVLTECPIQHLREKGLNIFQLFIDKLEAEAKHKFFRCMFITSHHAGVEGYIIMNIKNQIELSMRPHNGNACFLGNQCLPLLALVLCLPQGSETDLLQGMDRIMESLNLLRYLLIRDKEWKCTAGIWMELCRIKDDYLKVLRVCLSMSRTYYASEVKKLREDQKIKARKAKAARNNRLVKSITVRHEKVSDMSPEVQYQVLQCALVTFDLMESLIIRIEEITEEKVKNLQ